MDAKFTTYVDEMRKCFPAVRPYYPTYRQWAIAHAEDMDSKKTAEEYALWLQTIGDNFTQETVDEVLASTANYYIQKGVSRELVLKTLPCTKKALDANADSQSERAKKEYKEREVAIKRIIDRANFLLEAHHTHPLHLNGDELSNTVDEIMAICCNELRK